MNKNDLRLLRKLHGRMYERRLARKQKYFDDHIVAIGRKESLRQAKQSKNTEEDYPVDFVVTWVDGGDPEWLAEKNRYMPDNAVTKMNNPSARYRDWDLFRYWFRGVETYAPWVRNVYLVTWGHVPAWLNLDHPKLRVVRHKEFIPEEYLPTFNSNAIECNLWRINGLSEHFVYFNDDMYVTNPIRKTDFFYNGLPKHCGIARPLHAYATVGSWEHMILNDVGLINSSFSVRDCMAKNPEKWFSNGFPINTGVPARSMPGHIRTTTLPGCLSRI